MHTGKDDVSNWCTVYVTDENTLVKLLLQGKYILREERKKQWVCTSRYLNSLSELTILMQLC